MKLEAHPQLAGGLGTRLSIRLMLAAGLFSGLEIALPLFHDVFPLDRGVFAALSLIFTAVAFVTRLLAQRSL